MLSKLVLMLSKRKEMRKIFQNVETIFWRIEDIADETQKTECKKILLQGRYTIHAWTFLFVLWLFFCLRIKSLPLNCYQPKWMPLPFLIALENVTFILLSMGMYIDKNYFFCSLIKATEVAKASMFYNRCF
nr:unnamed protein product [Callosobruchus chinensis]